jgi:hypothetical protein
MDDEGWSEEEIDESKDVHEETHHDNHVEEPSKHIAPHLLESAALRSVPEKHEETIVVSKNERFADVTFDRRGTRSPEENIHGQRQIYNPKLRRFEEVPNQPVRESERHSRRPMEIMHRGPPRQGSISEQRRESFARPEEARVPRGVPVDPRLSSSYQRRPSFADRDPYLVHHRRESFISNSAVTDTDRSISNASPVLEAPLIPEQLSPIDLIALQQKEMAQSRKRAMERRAKDEEERLAAAERARKKAAELAVMATTSTTEFAKPSPVPSQTAPVTPKPSPAPVNVVPVLEQRPHEPQAKQPSERRDSGVWAATRDQEEIIKRDSPTKEEAFPRRSWGAIGSPQTNISASQKPVGHPPPTSQQNGLFSNPNTLAAINSAIGGDRRAPPRPGRPQIHPANVPPPLQGWADFATNSVTRKTHDDERQQERNLERDKIERERLANRQRTTTIVDKWKRVEIKEPEGAGEVANRTVVSVLKSGYVEDLAGNLEVRDLSGDRTEEGLPKMGPPPTRTVAKPPLVGAAPGLAIASPAPSLTEKTPRSRFFPPSTMVDLSPIAPPPSEPSLFSPGVLASIDEGTDAAPPSTHISAPPTTSNIAIQPQQPASTRPAPPLSTYAPGLPASPAQSLTAPQGSVTPRNAFSHTVPMSSPPTGASRQHVKIPSAADFDSVMERIRQTIQDSATQDPVSAKEFATQEVSSARGVAPKTQLPVQPQTGTEMSQSLVSTSATHRNLVISTRELPTEPSPTFGLRISFPTDLVTSSRDIDLPIEPLSRAIINLPSQTPQPVNTADLKSRLQSLDEHDRDRPPRISPRGSQTYKIQFAPSLRPRGGIVPNLVKKDKFGFPYINFDPSPAALLLPSYAHEYESFYAHREGALFRPKHHYNVRRTGPVRRRVSRGGLGEPRPSSRTAERK